MHLQCNHTRVFILVYCVAERKGPFLRQPTNNKTSLGEAKIKCDTSFVYFLLAGHQPSIFTHSKPFQIKIMLQIILLLSFKKTKKSLDNSITRRCITFPSKMKLSAFRSQSASVDFFPVEF